MSDIDSFFKRANTLLDRLETLLPNGKKALSINEKKHQCWRYSGRQSGLLPIEHISNIQLVDIQCVDQQKNRLEQNTLQFIQGLPANNALLWGPRGTGKSSLIKATFNHYRDKKLRLIEVDRNALSDLPALCDSLYDSKGRFILFCDDLSFEADDPSYKALKVIIDGSISQTPDNVLIYGTSNRRHLIPEYMNENVQSKMIDGELHLSESIEEKLSLSERFGLWLAFHPFNQDQYLQIVHYWLTHLGINITDQEELNKNALRWALERGSRSGRSANLFARDWAGKTQLEKQ